ncbi:MAG: nitroreductase family protein [Burkholderiaceae bacterium]
MSTIALNLETDTVVLPKPNLPSGVTLDQALKSRSSSRAFLPDSLPLEILSGLLWAAFGLNRSGGRTAPSAHNWQEIDIFVVLPEGAYRYEAQGHRLLLVKAEDLRSVTGSQDFVAGTPLNLVYVADFARMPESKPEERSFLAGADAGCIAQNVYLYCAAAGLATVVRGLIDRSRLAAALGLTKTERITLAQSVGYPAAA